MQQDIFSFMPIEVIQDHRLGLIETRVLTALFSFRNKATNVIWPSRAKIAERCGYSPVVISRAVTKLVNKGWLKRQQHRGPNTYEITTPEETVTDSVTVTDQDINSDRLGAETVTEPVTPELTRTNQRTYPPIVPPPNTASKKETGYPPDFETAWRLYPKRAGGNPKRDAFIAWRARLQNGARHEDILSGVIRYANFCEHTGKIATETVMQAKRFFGKAEPYLETWELPTNAAPNRAHETPSARASRIWRERNGHRGETFRQHESELRGSFSCEPGRREDPGDLGAVLEGDYSRETH